MEISAGRLQDKQEVPKDKGMREKDYNEQESRHPVVELSCPLTQQAHIGPQGPFRIAGY